MMPITTSSSTSVNPNRFFVMASFPGGAVWTSERVLLCLGLSPSPASKLHPHEDGHSTDQSGLRHELTETRRGSYCLRKVRREQIEIHCVHRAVIVRVAVAPGLARLAEVGGQ